MNPLDTIWDEINDYLILNFMNPYGSIEVSLPLHLDQTGLVASNSNARTTIRDKFTIATQGWTYYYV